MRVFSSSLRSSVTRPAPVSVGVACSLVMVAKRARFRSSLRPMMARSLALSSSSVVCSFFKVPSSWIFVCIICWFRRCTEAVVLATCRSSVSTCSSSSMTRASLVSSAGCAAAGGASSCEAACNSAMSWSFLRSSTPCRPIWSRSSAFDAASPGCESSPQTRRTISSCSALTASSSLRMSAVSLPRSGTAAGSEAAAATGSELATAAWSSSFASCSLAACFTLLASSKRAFFSCPASCCALAFSCSRAASASATLPASSSAFATRACGPAPPPPPAPVSISSGPAFFFSDDSSAASSSLSSEYSAGWRAPSLAFCRNSMCLSRACTSAWRSAMVRWSSTVALSACAAVFAAAAAVSFAAAASCRAVCTSTLLDCTCWRSSAALRSLAARAFSACWRPAHASFTSSLRRAISADAASSWPSESLAMLAERRSFSSRMLRASISST
mmetsp:Transcript_8717/g.36325  ORF Transcript_8717/g.36325 Transcript_8717/m.36325 type:complete len:444 (-) Transcript_8717:572-1903(-)